MKFDYYYNLLSDESFSIFLFHGVIENRSESIRNYNNKHILDIDFYRLLEGLCDIGVPVSMNQVIDFCNGKKIPKKSFAITFDDGFENNLKTAEPILRYFNIPATIYVATEFINKNLMSWIDRIEFAFEQISSFDLNLPWQNFKNVNSFSLKKKVLDEIRDIVKKDKKINQSNLADDIQKQLGLQLTYSNNSELDKKLDWGELKKLSNDTNFIIGGHTHNHSIMSYLNNEALEYEISQSLKCIETNLSIKTIHYSYPEGLEYCYNENVIRKLKEYGILCAPSAEYGTNKINADPFKLKRINVV